MVGYDHESREKVLLFKVLMNNGSYDYLTNKEIKAIDMSILVKFYENQIK
jgi:hypothetical protein